MKYPFKKTGVSKRTSHNPANKNTPSPEKFVSNFEGGKNFISKLKKQTTSALPQKKQEVKTAKGRRANSTRWLQWHLNDTYANLAKQEGYFSRAAYKLLEINEKFNLFTKGSAVIDLGAAPGGWSQVTAQQVGLSGLVIGVDLLPIKLESKNFISLQGDFLSETTLAEIKEALNGRKVDVILSDMAPNTTGNIELDHLKIMHLAENVLQFSEGKLSKSGFVVLKFFHGAMQEELSAIAKNLFSKVRFFKPKASRKESKEIYLIARNPL